MHQGQSRLTRCTDAVFLGLVWAVVVVGAPVVAARERIARLMETDALNGKRRSITDEYIHVMRPLEREPHKG
jgi:hypothetical protein